MDTPTKAHALDPVTGLAAELSSLSASLWTASDRTKNLVHLMLLVQGQDQLLIDMIDVAIVDLQDYRAKIAARLANEMKEAQS